jgi:hypothetical protein
MTTQNCVICAPIIAGSSTKPSTLNCTKYKTKTVNAPTQYTLRYLLSRIEVQAALLQHGEVLDEQPAVLDALPLPQLRAQLSLGRLK